MRRLLFRFAPVTTRMRLAALIVITASSPAGAATVTALPANAANVITSGFESPVVAGLPGGFAYAPAGTNWTFECNTGIAAVGGSFNVPSAPQGSQVGILQKPDPGCSSGTSRMTRSFTITTAGRYRLSLQSAQRQVAQVLNQQIASVRIDGIEIGQFKPAGAGFERFVFDGLLLQPGTHSLSLTALVLPGDNTLFIDDVRLDDIAAGSRRWSSASTWDSGSPPGLNDKVVIPSGSSVLLDTAAGAKTLSIAGDLHCADADVTLAAEQVMVSGRLVCGAPTSPYVNRFALTLKTPPANIAPGDADYKALMAMAPGVIELHGEPRKSWTQLGATANAGSDLIQLSETTGWRVGDRIVIAPTDYAELPSGEMTNQAEERLISEIVSANTVRLNQPLTHLHFGLVSTYTKPLPHSVWGLDERAEVGLLNRNIRIEGDGSSTTSGIGGHIMSMAGTQVHISGVELFRMGQKNIRGRYPFHWHLVGNAPGQYIRNSSVHASYNRCVTVHGTHDTLVADNVCYDFVGHGYFLEDGIETNNTFDHNLGVWARRPAVPATARDEPYSACPRYDGDTPDPVADIPLPLATDFREAAASNGPSVFWISNPNNTYTNNAAAGARGAGFWYHLDTAVTGESSLLPGACSVKPRSAPFGAFSNNRARASRQGFTSCFFGGDTYGMDSPNAVFDSLTTTNVGQGIWPCGAGHSRFSNAMVANTENGMQAPFPFAFNDSLFVAYTANAPARALRSADVPWSAVWVYDQGFDFDNVHFVNYDLPAMSVFQRVGGAHKAVSNRSSNLSFDNSPNVFRDIFGAWAPGTAPAGWGEVIHDLDGSLVGLAANGKPRAMVSSHPMMVDASCYREPASGIDGYGCQYRYSTLLIDSHTPGLSGLAPWITYLRSDGVHDTVQHGAITLRALHNFIGNGPYRHSYRFVDGPAHNRYGVMLHWSRLGASAVVELLDVPDTATVYKWQPQQTLLAAGSVNQLETSTENAYYYRPETASLFLKLHASVGIDWEAHNILVLCLDTDPACPAQARLRSRPSVQITAPANNARLAPTATAATPVTVTATLSDSQGLKWARLYSKDTLGGLQDWSALPTKPTSASVSLSINLPPGSHPLTLVVKNTSGESYTAIQQVHVGEAEARIAITAPANNDTYFASTAANLQYNAFNWSGSGKHVHWFVDGVDQGDAAASVSLQGLSQGRHVVGVALADASHNVYPMRDERVVHIVRNGYLADFEDGVDPRGYVQNHQSAAPVPLNYAWTALRIGRDSAADNDINWFDLPYAVASKDEKGLPNTALATYSLNFMPFMDWSGYTKLQINYAGPAFAVLVNYFGDSQPYPLGTALESGGASAEFVLPSRPGSYVTSVVLRHHPNPPGCTLCAQRQHLQSIRLLNTP